MLNPFIQVDGSHLQRLTESGKTEEVDAWEFKVSKELNKHFPGTKEMFFPEALYRATVGETTSERLVRSILLLGAQAVGKSNLANTAINDHTWSAAQPRSHEAQALAGQRFLYLSPLETGQRQAAFATAAAAGQGNSQARDSMTVPTSLNLRVLFLQPRRGTSGLNEAPSTFSPQWWRKFPSTLRSSWPASLILGKKSFPSSFPLRVVKLYDIAGEQVQTSFDQNLQSLLNAVDKIAILVDASEFSCLGGSASGTVSSVKEASKLISQPHHQPHCLIVTKLDKAKAKPMLTQDEALKQGWNQWTNREFSAAKPYYPTEEEEKTLLLQMLRNSADPAEQSIYQAVSMDANCRVYFIWSDGLLEVAQSELARKLNESVNAPAELDMTPDKEITPVGLHRFIREWCLEGVARMTSFNR